MAAEGEQSVYEVAYEEGRRRERVDQRLNSHEARLNAINGSIAQHARNADALRQAVDALSDDLGDKIDQVARTITTRTAVEQERARAVQEANEKQISNRTFWSGVVLIVVTLLGVIVALLSVVH